MANYIFLMDLGNNTSLTVADEHAMVKLTVAGCGFSFVGTMLSLCLICFLPMCTDGMFILCNMSVSLLSAQLAFIGTENAYPEKIICKVTTTVLHYLFLSLHCSSLAFSLHLLSKIRPRNPMDRSFKKVSVMFICWGLPLIISGVTVGIQGKNYGNDSICWLPRERGTRWAFLGPVAVILIINSIVFTSVLATRLTLDARKSVPFTKLIGNQIWTATSMFPVLGLMWIFGFSATFGQSKILQYVFVFITSTQGLSIFLCHVMSNSNVRKTLCTNLKPENPEDSLSEGLSEDFTHSSQVLELRDREAVDVPRGNFNQKEDCEKHKRRNSDMCEALKSHGSFLSPEGHCRLRHPRHSK